MLFHPESSRKRKLSGSDAEERNSHATKRRKDSVVSHRPLLLFTVNYKYGTAFGALVNKIFDKSDR